MHTAEGANAPKQARRLRLALIAAVVMVVIFAVSATAYVLVIAPQVSVTDFKVNWTDCVASSDPTGGARAASVNFSLTNSGYAAGTVTYAVVLDLVPGVHIQEVIAGHSSVDRTFNFGFRDCYPHLFQVQILEVR